jgi:hypothetical protein
LRDYNIKNIKQENVKVEWQTASRQARFSVLFQSSVIKLIVDCRTLHPGSGKTVRTGILKKEASGYECF